MPSPKLPRRPVFWLILLLAIGLPLLAITTYVDDWSRDWTTNTAATAADHVDPALRPLALDVAPSAVDELLQAFCGGQKRWRVAGEKPLPSDSPIAADGRQSFHLTHTTGLMGFVDDVWVVVEPVAAGDGVRVYAESRSRVGKGDLGQNPRNLRALLAGLRQLATSAP